MTIVKAIAIPKPIKNRSRSMRCFHDRIIRLFITQFVGLLYDFMAPEISTGLIKNGQTFDVEI